MNSSISCSVCCCFHLQMEEAFAGRFAGCNGVQLKSGTRFANFLDQQMNCNFLVSNTLDFILTLIFCLNQGVEMQLLTYYLNSIPKQKSKML